MNAERIAALRARAWIDKLTRLNRAWHDAAECARTALRIPDDFQPRSINRPIIYGYSKVRNARAGALYLRQEKP